VNLKLDHVEKYYDDVRILDKLDLSMKNIKVLALIGPSGSGKSTLLRLIAGLESFEGGNIVLNNQSIDKVDLTEYRKRIGFVFQDHNLFNHLSVINNICMIMEKVHHRKHTQARTEVEALLTKFGLIDHKNKQPHQISGGQAQRVSIVRALAIQPEVILLDEPTSSLDPVLTFEVLKSIETLVEDNKDVILVTHEIGFARELADYIIYMEEGRIIEHGATNILEEPQTEKLRIFLDKVLSFH
jgi:polar amino acid transport system ATP-binding protein